MDHCKREKRVKNPRDSANIFSILTFAYTGGLFKKAFKKELEEQDLYDVIKSCRSKENGDQIEGQWKKLQKGSIPWLIWKCFGLRYLFYGLIQLSWKIISSTMEPYAMGQLIGYFKPGQTAITQSDAFYYAGTVIGLYILHLFYNHNYYIILQQLAIQIRTAFSSLIYRKALKLSPAALADISLGNIVTLVTKDVYSFEQSIALFNDMWIGILRTVLICYLLFRKLGWSSLIGVSILLSVLPIQMLLGSWVSKMRLMVGKKSDERLQMTQETLSAIRTIKMYTWEKFFNDQLTDFRRKELRAMLSGFYIKIVIVALGVLCTRFGFYMMIMSYIWFGNTANAEIIFYTISLVKDLKSCVGTKIPLGLARAAELYAALSRIGTLIKAEELQESPANHAAIKPSIHLKNATVSIKHRRILRNITLEFNSGLTVITGVVGSGKSSLLKAILQDYPLDEGTLSSNGRISYASQDPWLFPSSIKQNILFGQNYDEARYKEVIRVCALHYDLEQLEKSDETIVADRGINLSKGQQARINLARAIYRTSDIYLLDDSLTALDAHVQDYIFQECIRGYLKNRVCVLVIQNVACLNKADMLVVLEDGAVKTSGRPQEIILENIVELPGEDIGRNDEAQEEVGENYDEHQRLLEEELAKRQKVYSEFTKKGSVSFNVYKHYFSFGGGLSILSSILIVFFLYQLSESFADKFITRWVDYLGKVQVLESENRTNSSEYLENVAEQDYTLTLYSIMVFVSTPMSLLKSFLMLTFCRIASLKIHKAMSYSIINSVMSFFDSHFIGNILNRFSQDLNNIDEYIPPLLTEGFSVLFSLAGTLILIVSVNWKFLIPIILFFVMLMLMRMVYMPTGRSLKRLEAATRSPLVGHLNASLEGLTTIRAYQSQEILKEEFDRHQDLYTSAHYSSVCTMKAFGFFMDSLCVIFIMVVIATFLFIDTETSAGNVGLAIIQVIILAHEVEWGVRQWADVENQMTSVERTLEYTSIQTENKTGRTIANWPSKGAITYENVTLTYRNNEQVLKNISFSLGAKQKIGIVGRTGAGKSSIISTLFRLYDFQGKIFIDNEDIKTISLDFLRKNIAIIPQDPLLFTGTIRSNIDPYKQYPDEEIWTVLEKVKIKNFIPGLDFKINENSSNFSSGQRQLICLARAIIRKNRIIVLDEATANMDPETDELLHNVIKDNFRDCTVFSIAHRLHTILDADRIMVLDKGEIVEFDEPGKLLKDKNGYFYKMVQQSEPRSAKSKKMV